MQSVNIVQTMFCSLLVCFALSAEDQQMAPDEVVGSVQTWLQENVDDWVFEEAGIDRKAIDRSLNLAQQELSAAPTPQTEPSRQDAERMVRLLGNFEETRPYAQWLDSFLGQHLMQPSPTNSVDTPSTPPTPQEMRMFWVSAMTNRPAPARANEYLTQIKPIFRAEKVPVELIWLAEVESAFDPHARSPVGAVGLFQLMPDTAKSLGLSIWLPDERENAEKNARAAAKYLHQLHDRFGEWRLALAAYNAGPTRVSTLLKKSDDYSYDAIVRQLPEETRSYVARAEATLFIREGVVLTSLRGTGR